MPEDPVGTSEEDGEDGRKGSPGGKAETETRILEEAFRGRGSEESFPGRHFWS